MPGFTPKSTPDSSKASSSSSSTSASPQVTGTKPKVSQNKTTYKKNAVEFFKKVIDLVLQQLKSMASGSKKDKAKAKGHPKGSLKSPEPKTPAPKSSPTQLVAGNPMPFPPDLGAHKQRSASKLRAPPQLPSIPEDQAPATSKLPGELKPIRSGETTKVDVPKVSASADLQSAVDNKKNRSTRHRLRQVPASSSS